MSDSTRRRDEPASGSSPADTPLSHVDESGAAKMVDVGHKQSTTRTASAIAICSMTPQTAGAIRANSHAKGDVLAVARIAGIQAAKRTPELIPLCHSVPLSSVQVEFEWLGEDQLRIEGFARCVGQTGVEMEALCAVSIAALTIYDMCKAMDREIEIQSVRLNSKTGGKSDYQRSSDG